MKRLILNAMLALLAVESVYGHKCAPPPNFPEDKIKLRDTYFHNWSEEIRINRIWVAYPKTQEDIVILANWAYKNNQNLRPSGGKFSWSPLTYPAQSQSQSQTPSNSSKHSCQEIVPNVVLVSTLNIKKIQVTVSGSSSSVTAEAGACMDSVSWELSKKKLGFEASPAMGQATIGGVIASGSHGIGVSLQGYKIDRNLTQEEYEKPGKFFGSLSNLVIRLKAIVYNRTREEYEIQTFERSDPRIAPLLANLGTIFLTEVTLRVGKDERLRCKSITNVPAKTVFAKPNKTAGEETPPAKNSFADFVQKSGMLGLLYFPFADEPWIRIWSKREKMPKSSRPTYYPYNYDFEENLPESLQHGLVESCRLQKNTKATKNMNRAFAEFIKKFLKGTQTEDLWGLSKDVMYYVENTTLKASVTGFAILTNFTQIQDTVSQVYEIYSGLYNDYARKGKYPLNGPMEIRLTGLDEIGDIEDSLLPPNPVPPSFTANSPYPPRPDYDVSLWVDVTTLCKSEYVPDFMFDIESLFFNAFDGKDGRPFVRSEWTKRWGYSKQNGNSSSRNSFEEAKGPWTNASFIKRIPERYADWDGAVKIIRSLDPYRVFRNPFLDLIIPEFRI